MYSVTSCHGLNIKLSIKRAAVWLNDEVKKDISFSFFFYRWPVDQTKREAAGTEECRRMDVMLGGLIETESLLHR